MARRESLAHLVLAGAASLFAVALAESVLHVVPAFRPIPRWFVGEQTSRPSEDFVPDSLTGWRMRAHHDFTAIADGEGAPHRFTGNAQGMRDPDDFDSACARPRIVLVGDSFFWGAGLEYSETVGAQLADSLGHQADVYNLGMPGFGVDQMFMSLRNQALALCPSLVVVGFVDADWERSLSAFRSAARWMSKPMFVVDGDSLRLATVADDRPGLIARTVQRHSSLWLLVEQAIRRRAYTAGEGTWWVLNTALLDAMARDARQAGVPVLIMRLPARNAWRAFPALGKRMARNGIPYVDLADPSLRRSDIHLSHNLHFNALGAAYTAGAICTWLRAEGPAALQRLLSP